MEFLKLSCVAPHPPILVPEVGRTETRRIESTTLAMEELAGEISSAGPDTLIVISPHTPIYPDAFSVRIQKNFSGSLGSFGAPQVKLSFSNDLEMAESIAKSARSMGIPLETISGGPLRGGVAELDHGMMVPLYFLGDPACSLVSLTVSLLDYWTHYRLGIAIRDAVERSARPAVFVASGDLSHRLKPGAPAGYDPRAADFDAGIERIMKSGNYDQLFKLDQELIEDAGECGLRPIFVLAGTMDGYDVESRVLSYEGPFGVGYMVARVIPGKRNPERSFAPPTGG